MIESLLPFCECGECGLRVTKPGNRFIVGHVQRGKKLSGKKLSGKKLSPEHCKAISKGLKGKLKSPESIAKMSKTLTGRKLSPEHRKTMREALLREKEPLPNGWKVDRDSKSVTNKESTQYLGCYIAEQVLSKTFRDVKMMPYGNHGFDIICNRNLKIDIKSAATGDKNSEWFFNIQKNQTADYFLCIAFDNRDDLIPEHLWLIPGKDINHHKGVSISKTTIAKWSQYEQPLDKVVACCNKMKGDK